MPEIDTLETLTKKFDMGRFMMTNSIFNTRIRTTHTHRQFLNWPPHRYLEYPVLIYTSSIRIRNLKIYEISISPYEVYRYRHLHD